VKPRHIVCHINLVCHDVAAGATFFQDILALPVRQRGPRYAEVDLGRLTASLTPAPATPSPGPRPPGVVLPLEVGDVDAAVLEVRRRGATVLLETVLTEWGTESAFIAGPDDMIIELYRSRGL
jgi:catechol 2,3-dioxygenase-like lactoylglutathione lyase family enzyme